MKRDSRKHQVVNILLVMGILAIVMSVVNYYYKLWRDFHPVMAQEVVSAVEPEREVALLMEGEFPADGEYCLTCHEGIEPARPFASAMMREIMEKGAGMGDPNGCVVCHGGNPSETIHKDRAHKGVPAGSELVAFTPVPSSLQVNDRTCGLCHSDHVYNVHRSNMNTDAGKMKAILWSWGIGVDTHDHRYADHAVEDTDGGDPRFGSDVYKAYMREMAESHPGQFPDQLAQIPEVSLDSLAMMPEQAAFTYLRNCNACHLGAKGMQDRGHYRGMGCAACHNLYGNEGYYEGNDRSIDKDKPGHVMVHSMQGTRKSVLNVNGKRFSGIQVSTCAACHSAGRRIGHAYQGLMALDHSDNRGPFDAQGMPQEANAGYVFKYIRNDAHHRVTKDGKSVTGLLCQDCHTTNSMHGNGNIGATTLAAVEIECADCHGTPDKYPWELPVGYGDEFGKTLEWDKPRGCVDHGMEGTSRFAYAYPRQDGYLVSARGNAFGNVVRSGNKVIVHSDTGEDFEAPVLKTMALEDSWSDPVKAKTAMIGVKRHMESLECYACHSTWAAQYYGYKYVIDYSKRSIDWLKSAEQVGADGTTADYRGEYVTQPGAPTYGDYSHMRWENPPLGINGEGRVTPLVGVIQTVGTVIGPDGQTVVWNRVAKTAEGYDATELAPLNPHTTSKAARECSDCHGNPVAMGYGMDGGVYDAQPGITHYADVVTADAENVSRYTKAQIHAIRDLQGDFMRILDQQGKQVQTVDSHWPASMPLTASQRDLLSRNGTCMACHQDIPDGSIPMRMLGKVAQVAQLSFASPDEHAHLLRENNILIAWIKMIGIISLVLMIPILILCWVKRRWILEKIRLFRIAAQMPSGGQERQ